VTETSNLGPIKKVVTTEVAKGKATDNNGNVYRFTYDNVADVANVEGSATIYKGIMTDRFTLRGRGPVHLDNGFVAILTQEVGTDNFKLEPINSFGDSFDFEGGSGRCDPI
jgi:hypothetical protein